MNLRTLITDDAQRTPTKAARRASDGLILVGMFLGMALIYRTVSLPWIGLGLLIFGLLALLRPALALLFVPFVVPWYLSPVYIPDIRAQGTVLPLAEVLLLVTFAATVARATFAFRPSLFVVRRSSLLKIAPHVLFLLAGILGVAIALERGPALRDFRWMVAEPLLFYGLVRWFSRRDTTYTHRVAVSLVLSGAFVAVLGLLQVVGINLVATLLSPTKSYADEVVITNGLERVTSVYGHPNNLGLLLGRVWPVALALAAIGWSENNKRGVAIFYSASTLLCLGGIAVSLSRGAWLGAVAAVAVLLVGLTTPGRSGSRAMAQRLRWGRWALVAAALLVVAIVSGLVVFLRGGVTGGSTDVRLLFWRESLQLIARHPLGLGLDQYYYYHNPEFGRNLIPAATMEYSEWHARHPHNLLFELWLLLTPFGLAAVVWLIVRFFRRGAAIIRAEAENRSRWLVLGALAAMAAALTHGLVDSFYFWPDLALVFWLLLAVVDEGMTGRQDDKVTR